MKLDCVLTSCNLNEVYLDFIPLFVMTWKKLYPTADVKVILINDSIPENLKDWEDHIICFEPIPTVSTAFTSQYIRVLYPALMTEYENGILITDIDMIPMNRTYYTEPIKDIENNKFVNYRNVLLNIKQLAICYNIACPSVWSEIFPIKSKEDVVNNILELSDKINYIDGHGKNGWYTDQQILYNKVFKWNKETNNFVLLKDCDTGFNRIGRGLRFTLTPDIVDSIKNGRYTDYHCYRPFKQYKEINEAILEIL